ncbi:type II secretion system protein GspM [Sphingomonas sp.]|uniref:type II secretion system protein GspM n=1 Tax=Sphingomonas sp. TaxID=28214 RepID=UPI001D2BB82B|nr:type II secretion system protein GspM [Sphingomonas sp.]MBX9796316.1 type II secretion system protein M [Sphingomonas sp.]
MIGALGRWFTALSPRERALIGIAALLLAGIVGWFGIVRPATIGLEQARARHAAAAQQLATVQGQLAALTPLAKAGPAKLNAPLDTVLRERATLAGFTLSTVSAQSDNGVLIALPAARPRALFGWIAALEADGILVQQLQVTDNGDQTLSVSVTLRARGL